MLYDFGSVKRFSPEELVAAGRIIKGIFYEDYDDVELGMVELGARNPEGPPVDSSVYKIWRDVVAPVFSEEEPFDFAVVGSPPAHDDHAPRVHPRGQVRSACPRASCWSSAPWRGFTATCGTCAPPWRGGLVVKAALDEAA